MKTDNPTIITICGSMQAADQMVGCANELQGMGISCHLPTLDERVDYAVLPKAMRAPTKSILIRAHVDKINVSDAVLIYNISLDDRENYIGANTFLEMGVAFAFGKKIYLLNDIPNQPNTDEIAGMLPICLKGHLVGILN